MKRGCDTQDSGLTVEDALYYVSDYCSLRLGIPSKDLPMFREATSLLFAAVEVYLEEDCYAGSDVSELL